MDNADSILTYLQGKGRSRPVIMMNDLTMARRKLFRILSRLVKSGQVYKEGTQPQVYYVARIIPVSSLARALPQAPAEKKSNVDSKEKDLLLKQLQEAQEEQARLKDNLNKKSHELYETKNELNRKNMDLKHQEALVNSRDGSIKQWQELSNEYREETKRLRADIKDLQENLREAQRQAVLKK